MEGRFRQSQVTGELMQHPLALVVRIEKACILIWKDEGIGSRYPYGS